MSTPEITVGTGAPQHFGEASGIPGIHEPAPPAETKQRPKRQQPDTVTVEPDEAPAAPEIAPQPAKSAKE